MSGRRSRERKDDSFMATGWLYADLLLALAVVFLAAVPGLPLLASREESPSLTATAESMAGGTPTADSPPATATPPPTVLPTPSPTETATPSPIVAPGPVGLSPNAQCYELSMNQSALLAGSIEAEQQLLHQLQQALPNTADVPVGMVIVWARGELVPGLLTAKRVNELLQTQLPNSFAGAATKSLYFPGRPDLVRVEVYFYTDRPWSSSISPNPCP